jgi:hypothetical protein
MCISRLGVSIPELIWGGLMKNREEWRQIVQEAKAHPEL